MNKSFDIFITRYRNFMNLKRILPIVNPLNYNKIKDQLIKLLKSQNNCIQFIYIKEESIFYLLISDCFV